MGTYLIAIVLAVCVLFLGALPVIMVQRGTAKGYLNKRVLHRDDDPEAFDRELRLRTRAQRLSTALMVGAVLVFAVIIVITVPRLG